MMATSNSGALVLIGLLASLAGGWGEDVDADGVFRERAQAQLEAARAKYRADTNDLAAAWLLGRATFERADFAQSAAEREALAQEGITVCRGALAQQPGSAAAHYYLGLNLGQLARVRLLKGLGLVAEMEQVFRRAREEDSQLDFAGPDRTLGLLHWRAPGWPLSIGDLAKARRYLERATRLCPDYPDNRLCLAEFLLANDDRAEFLRQVSALAELWPRARGQLSGEAWEWSWRDWDQRWQRLRTRAEILKPKR
jgi:tetratricopeptide (TPR) repeat protein